MGAAIGQVLPFAVGVALSPVPIIVVALSDSPGHGPGRDVLRPRRPVRPDPGGLRDWMAQHNAAIMAVLCLVIGAKLIGDAISGFSM